jgi:transcriptional regulator with XRE-family HTH domain
MRASATAARPSTPLEIAKFGHIAVALRAVMVARDWSPGALNQAMGLDRNNTAIYLYLRGQGQPSPERRRALSAATGIPEADLMARDPEAPLSAAALAAPQRALIVHRKPPQPQRPPAVEPPVLQFTAHPDGTARLAFDVTMATEKAVPLLRILLDAGMIIARE